MDPYARSQAGHEGSVMRRGWRRDHADDAAAEVIGTIVLVAVAVILAALISSFTFGLATGVTRTVAIAVSATQSGDDVLLTYEGGRDVPSLYTLEATATAEDGTAVSLPFAKTPPAAGDTLTLPGAGTPGRDRVVVVAGLVDGSRQVVLDVAI